MSDPLASDIRALVAVVERAHDRQERDHERGEEQMQELRVALAELPGKIAEVTRAARDADMTEVRRLFAALQVLVEEQSRIARHSVTNTVLNLGLDVAQYVDRSGDRALPSTEAAGGESLVVARHGLTLRWPGVRRVLVWAALAAGGAVVSHLPQIWRLLGG